MNLRVDLIMKSEQRSASVINLRMLTRLATFFFPAVAILLITISTFNMVSLSAQVKAAEAAWERAEPRKKTALAIRARLDRNKGILSELDQWSQSRLDWSAHLSAIQKTIRPNLQLTRIQIRHELQSTEKKMAARIFKGSVDGTAIGTTAREDVAHLQNFLEKGDHFSNSVDTVIIPEGGFGAAPDQKQNRFFRLAIDFKPKVFENGPTVK